MSDPLSIAAVVIALFFVLLVLPYAWSKLSESVLNCKKAWIPLVALMLIEFMSIGFVLWCIFSCFEKSTYRLLVSIFTSIAIVVSISIPRLIQIRHKRHEEI